MDRLTPEKLLKLQWDMSHFMAVRFQDEITPGEPTFPVHYDDLRRNRLPCIERALRLRSVWTRRSKPERIWDTKSW